MKPNLQGFTYVAPSVLEEMNQPRVITARSPRRTPRHRDDHLRMAFPQQSHQSGSSHHSHFHHQNNHHHRMQFSTQVRQTPPHLQGFVTRPTNDETMMDVQQGLPIV